MSTTVIDDVLLEAGFENYDEFKEALQLVGNKAQIVLKRETKDVWINQYNPDLLRAWNANMDVQFVLDPYQCVMYIVSYISKPEHELSDVLKSAQEELKKSPQQTDLATQMKKLGTVYFENREVSVQESIVRTCSIRMKDSTRQVVFIPTDQNARLSKPLAQIEAISDRDSETDVWMTSLEDRYKARPKLPEFNSMCQATFASEYRVLAKAEAQSRKDKPEVYKLQNDKGYIAKRTRGSNAVIRFTKYSPTNNSEKYFETQLKLYLPWRLDSHLKPNEDQTFEEFHDNGAVKINRQIKPVKQIVAENKAKYEKASSELAEAWQTLQDQGPLEDAWSTVSPETDLARRQALENRDPTENDDRLPPEQIPDLHVETPQAKALVSVEWLGENMRPFLRCMNENQKEVFYHVRNWCVKKALGENPDPFFIHVTGGAGTGKSHLIKCIYHEASKLLKNRENPEEVKVLLVAPTGTAAFNIGGYTIHSAFKVPCHIKKDFQRLSDDTRNTLRMHLSGIDILIIDEISMVDRKVLAYIHGRLREIKGIRTTDRTSHFGNVSVLAVGDFYQLPPVRAHPLVIPNAEQGIDLWKELFSIAELNQIMRQKDDVPFANLLNRLRTKSKSQTLSEEDIATLTSRSDRSDTPPNALHVYALNENVDKHNEKMLTDHCDMKELIDALDYKKSKLNGEMEPMRHPSRQKQKDGLPRTLELGKDARVMLLRNLDVSDGLVNGVFGRVQDFVKVNDRVTTVHVKFDNEKVGKNRKLNNGAVPIEMTEETLDSGIVRRQFPLKLAWACTVHKVQGMTVSEIVYDMTATKNHGQAYVALSRATSLNGLFIKNFNPKHIYCSNDVANSLTEMPRFREKISAPENAQHIIHHNTQGLRSKLDDIRSNSDMTASTVLAVTETWLKKDMDDATVTLEGYEVCRKDRSDEHGGVAVYVKDNVTWNALETPTRIECCAVQVHPENEAPFIVAAIYRSPRFRTADFTPLLENLLDFLCNKGCPNVFVLGDFNENQLKEGNHPIMSVFAHYDFAQRVTSATTRYGSMLDLVFVRSTSYQCSTLVLPTYYSDHDAVQLSLTN